MTRAPRPGPTIARSATRDFFLQAPDPQP